LKDVSFILILVRLAIEFGCFEEEEEEEERGGLLREDGANIYNVLRGLMLSDQTFEICNCRTP
jgi:hypothetical protein